MITDNALWPSKKLISELSACDQALNAWFYEAREVESETTTVYKCENEDAIVKAHPDMPEGFHSCVEAPDVRSGSWMNSAR